MSGLNEIIQWTEKEIDLEVFDNAGEAYNAISDQFVADNRNDLDSILLDDKADYLSFLRENIEDIRESDTEDEADQIDSALDTETSILQGLRSLFG